MKWIWGEMKLILGKIKWVPLPSCPPLFPHLPPCRLGSTVGTMSTTTMCRGHARPQCRASATAATWGSRGAGLSVLTTLRPLRDLPRPLTACQRPLRPPGVPQHPIRPPQYPPTPPGPERSRCMSVGHERVTPGTFGVGCLTAVTPPLQKDMPPRRPHYNGNNNKHPLSSTCVQVCLHRCMWAATQVSCVKRVPIPACSHEGDRISWGGKLSVRGDNIWVLHGCDGHTWVTHRCDIGTPG